MAKPKQRFFVDSYGAGYMIRTKTDLVGAGGGFDTFMDAKRAAILMCRADIDDLKMIILSLKSLRKKDLIDGGDE